MFARALRLTFYLILALQFFHLIYMGYIKHSLDWERQVEPVSSLGAFWLFLVWSWVALFLLAATSHLWKGPLKAKEAALSFAVVLVLPVLQLLTK